MGTLIFHLQSSGGNARSFSLTGSAASSVDARQLIEKGITTERRVVLSNPGVDELMLLGKLGATEVKESGESEALSTADMILVDVLSKSVRELRVSDRVKEVLNEYYFFIWEVASYRSAREFLSDLKLKAAGKSLRIGTKALFEIDEDLEALDLSFGMRHTIERLRPHLRPLPGSGTTP